MNLLQMMMARKMQRQQYGASGASAAGCGCLGSIVSLVAVIGSLVLGYVIWNGTMNAVDESLDQADRMVEDAVEEFQGGEVSGVGYEGDYSCEADGSGAVATLEITNTDSVAHTFDLTWSLFAVPTGFDTDFDDLGDLGDVGLGDGDVIDSIEDTFTLQPGEAATKTYDLPEMSEENVGCSSPFLLTDMPGSVPETPAPEVPAPDVPVDSGP